MTATRTIEDYVNLERCIDALEDERVKLLNANEKMIILLQQAFDALEATTDSDLDYFDDEKEEAEAVPEQYACRKIMECIGILRNTA